MSFLTMNSSNDPMETLRKENASVFIHLFPSFLPFFIFWRGVAVLGSEHRVSFMLTCTPPPSYTISPLWTAFHFNINFSNVNIH